MDYKNKPRTGTEMEHAVHGDVPIYMYSDVCTVMKEKGAPQTLRRMFANNHKCIILLQDPNKPTSGHWTSLSIYPRRKEIYFFSSYGGKPDEEKNRWISPDGQVRSQQEVNPLNDGLKEMTRRGWTVHYNEFPYQHEGDGTATCGIWVAAFLNSDMNPTDFFAYNSMYGMTDYDYYKIYFQGKRFRNE